MTKTMYIRVNHNTPPDYTEFNRTLDEQVSVTTNVCTGTHTHIMKHASLHSILRWLTTLKSLKLISDDEYVRVEQALYKGLATFYTPSLWERFKSLFN